MMLSQPQLFKVAEPTF